MATIDEDASDVGDSLHEYVAQFYECLRWDPHSNTKGPEKQAFVEALTEIAALPLDSISMEIRRLLVVVEDTTCNALAHLISALGCRDVLLKCKAANAIGSLCISRVAGQQLLDSHGDAILQSLEKMATCKNQWAQGDAFFVLGWVVVIADDAMLGRIARLLPSVIKLLHRNLRSDLSTRERRHHDDRHGNTVMSTEPESNFRIYALVLLLNFSQRDVSLLTPELEKLLSMLHDIVHILLASPMPSSGDNEHLNAPSSYVTFESSEYVELLRLTITLLSLVVDQIEDAPSLVLALKMLPSLLKLRQILNSTEDQESLVVSEKLDLQARMDVLIDTVVACR